MEFHVIFHGSLNPPNEISLSSMEFHGTLRLSFYSMSCYPGLPWDIPWISSIEWPNKKINELLGIPWNKEVVISNDTGVLWNSMEHSMEFHGTLVPPNEISFSSMEFHGTLRLSSCTIPYFLDFHGIFHGIPWNSGVAKLKITHFQVIPWNYEGAISNDTRVPWNSMEYSMEFYWTLVPPYEISLSSMEFHGTLRLSFY